MKLICIKCKKIYPWSLLKKQKETGYIHCKCGNRLEVI